MTPPLHAGTGALALALASASNRVLSIDKYDLATSAFKRRRIGRDALFSAVSEADADADADASRSLGAGRGASCVCECATAVRGGWCYARCTLYACCMPGVRCTRAVCQRNVARTPPVAFEGAVLYDALCCVSRDGATTACLDGSRSRI